MKPCLKTNKLIKGLVLDSAGRALMESQESLGSVQSSKPGVVAKAAPPNTEKWGKGSGVQGHPQL